MKEKTTETNSVTRRKALQVLGVGVIAPSVLSACQQESGKPAAKKKKEGMEKEGSATAKTEAKKEKAEKEAAEKQEPKKEEAAGEEMAAKAEGGEGGELNCNDPKYYDAQSAQMRKTLQYVEKSEKEGKQCDNCMQWITVAEAEHDGPKGCGGCKLFKGPVNPKGYCLSYAPMQS